MFSGLRAVACLGVAFTASADSALELNGENAYISIDGLIPHLPSAQFTVSMWVFPTPGLKSGLGTTFAMNTATGGNVMSLAVDRDTSEYVYKVRCCPPSVSPRFPCRRTGTQSVGGTVCTRCQPLAYCVLSGSSWLIS